MGETAACEYLLRQGMHFLERRYRSYGGEIDLIMLDGDTLVLVEVKCRERSSSSDAQQAVTPAKQRRLIHAARCYLGEHPEHFQRPIRFDVIAVAADGFLHIPDAFQGSEW